MVAGIVAQFTVDFREGAKVVVLLQQVVPGLVAEPAGVGFEEAAEFEAARIDEDVVVREVRARQHGDQFLGAFHTRRGWHQERPRVAGPGPGAGACSVRVQGPVPLLWSQLLAGQVFGGNDHVRALSQPCPPDAGHVAIAGPGEVLVGGGNLHALEIPAGEEVGHPGHGVRPVDGGRAFLQHLDALHGDRRKGVDVDVAPADEARRQMDLAPAVKQHEGPRRAQAAQIHVGDGFRHGGDFVRVVPALPLADHPVAETQSLEELGHEREALFLQPPARHHRHRIGQFRSRHLRAGAGHHQFV